MNARILARTAALLLLAIQFAPALGDEWDAAKVRNVFSQNGEYFVRIVPGDSSGARSSTAQFYALRKEDRSYRLIADVPLKNAIQPAFAKLTDEGYLVTFDDWFSIGRKTVIAFYGPQGKLIRTIDISELYRPEELLRLPFSKTITTWRCGIRDSVDDAGRAVVHVSGNGSASFVLDPKAGSFKRVASNNTCGGSPESFSD